MLGPADSRFHSREDVARDLRPSHLAGIELVWHRLNRRHDLALFLRSSVRWAECDARIAPTGEIVVSHSSGTEGDRPFEEWLEEVARAGRAAKIDLKEGGPTLDGVIAVVARSSIPDEDLWFNAAPEAVGGRRGFERFRDARPGARRSIPLDTLASWLQVMPRPALAMLDDTRSWDVNRLSISVQTQTFQEVVRLVARECWPTNVWDVSDETQFGDALVARPSSITADLGIVDPRSFLSEPIVDPAPATDRPAQPVQGVSRAVRRSASRTAAPPGSLLKYT